MDPIEAAKNRAYDLLGRTNASLEAGEISEERWFVVAPGGRLIIGTHNEERDGARAEPSREMTVASETALVSWGFPIAGRSERPHYHDDRLLYRIIWIDAPNAGTQEKGQ